LSRKREPAREHASEQASARDSSAPAGGQPARSAAAANKTDGSGRTVEAPPGGDGGRAGPAATASEKAEKLVILAGGDVNLGRTCGQQILKDPGYNPFKELGALFSSADLRFVNLESQLSDQNGETQSRANRLIFTGPPGGADVLKNAGIDLVSLANNHAWDYGKKAFLETLANLGRAGVPFVGASEERGRQYEPTIINVKGWRIAWFAVTSIWNQGPFDDHPAKDHVAWTRFDILNDKLLRARKENDVVILSHHGGSEYVEVPMQWTREFVKPVMRAGVDAIVGHHPHVPQGVGWQGGRPIFYSLGNLVFAMHSDYPWTGTGFFARLTFYRDGRREVEACPYDILGHVPTLFSGDTKAARENAFAQHLRYVSVAAGRSEVGPPGELSCMPLEPPTPKAGPAALARARNEKDG